MSVRPLDVSVDRWPDRETVVDAAAKWARQAVEHAEGILRIGYFGSYARGDWGYGSDVDLVVILGETDLRFEERTTALPQPRLPVPADVLVYTAREWEARSKERGMVRQAREEAVWLWERAV